MSIEDVAAELYGLAPEEFTAARNARAKGAKAGGDAELAAQVQSLRKPTAGAWLLNQLVRQHGGRRAAGARPRRSAARGPGHAGGRRAAGPGPAATAADPGSGRAGAGLGRAAGRRVTAATTAEVEETLRSAMVDAVAGAALATGLLTDTFSSTGLDPVDLSRVVALPPVGGTASAPPATAASQAADHADAARQRRVADAERAVAEAESALKRARTVLEQATRDAVEATGASRTAGGGARGGPAASRGARRAGGDSHRGGGERRPGAGRGAARGGLGGRGRGPVSRAARGAAGVSRQRGVSSTMPRHISSVVPSPQAT